MSLFANPSGHLLNKAIRKSRKNNRIHRIILNNYLFKLLLRFLIDDLFNSERAVSGNEI